MSRWTEWDESYSGMRNTMCNIPVHGERSPNMRFIPGVNISTLDNGKVIYV